MKCFNMAFKRVIPVCCLLIGLTAYAQGQSFVDTTPQNKNVVFEEFTGLNCPFCPDGHKIANNIRANNQGDVVLINVHTGGYARPRPGQPDFRSGFGGAIANQMGVQAYPNASVNRKPFRGSKSFGRRNGKWPDACEKILKQPSPVNVAVQTNLNPDTRKLTVDVEVYYTDSSKANSNKLNVALLQNDVHAYQSAATFFYQEKVLKNGEYEHEHMLRELLTGQWGDNIDKPYKGNLIQKTYTYQVPEDYENVPVNLAKLEVAAFVARGKENILTGTSQKVQLPDKNLTDLAVSNATSKDLCAAEVDPAFKVENKGNQPVNDFKLRFRFQDQIYERTFNQTIQPGSAQTLKWGTPLKLEGGSFNIKMERIGALNDGDLYDEKLDNNFPRQLTSISFPNVTVDSNFKTSFEGDLSNSVAIDNSKNPAIGAVSSSDNPVGAQNTNSAARILVDPRFRGNNGQNGYILVGKAALTNMNEPYMTYYYAYSKGNRDVPNMPEITLQYSADCGQTWQDVGKSTVKETNQFDPTAQEANVFTPKSDDYKQAEFDVSDLKDKGPVIFRLVLPGTDGNAIYLDELQLGEKSEVTGIQPQQASKIQTDVYPNPASSKVNIDLTMPESSPVDIEIFNATGKRVKTVDAEQYSAGSNSLNLNVENWEAGIYTARIQTAGDVRSVKFMVVH